MNFIADLSIESKQILLDYFLIIVPIIVSCVAIVISLISSNKQNKIAMFNIRYASITQFQTILNFAQGVKDCDDPRIILRLFDSLWGTNGTKLTFEDNLIQYRCKLESIKNDVLQSKYAFKYNFNIEPGDIVFLLHETIMSAISSKNVSENVKKFTSMCDEFYEKDYNKISKQTKI